MGTIANSISVKEGGKSEQRVRGFTRQEQKQRKMAASDCTFARQIKLSSALSLSSGLQPHNH